MRFSNLYIYLALVEQTPLADVLHTPFAGVLHTPFAGVLHTPFAGVLHTPPSLRDLTGKPFPYGSLRSLGPNLGGELLPRWDSKIQCLTNIMGVVPTFGTINR